LAGSSQCAFPRLVASGLLGAGDHAGNVLIKGMKIVGLDSQAQHARRHFTASQSQAPEAFIGSVVWNMLQRWEHPITVSGLRNNRRALVSGASANLTSVSGAQREASIKEDIEDSGLFGGIAARVKKSGRSPYLNQSSTKIEARIDRKLDEIDRRLAEWRDPAKVRI